MNRYNLRFWPVDFVSSSFSFYFSSRSKLDVITSLLLQVKLMGNYTKGCRYVKSTSDVDSLDTKKVTEWQIIKKFSLATCRIVISTRSDLSVVGPLLSSNHCVSDAVRYHRSTTTVPDNSILSIHRSFSAVRCRSWWYRIQNSFFFLITHGDFPPPPIPALSSRSSSANSTW